jgi:hypothetical protein
LEFEKEKRKRRENKSKISNKVKEVFTILNKIILIRLKFVWAIEEIKTLRM